MPKAANQSMKPLTQSPPARPPPRAIKPQGPPPSGPKVRPNAMGAPMFADQLKPASKPKSGSIDPRQMRY